MDIQPFIPEEMQGYLVSSFDEKTIQSIIDVLRACSSNPNSPLTILALEGIMTGKPTLPSAARWFYESVRRGQKKKEDEEDESA